MTTATERAQRVHDLVGPQFTGMSSVGDGQMRNYVNGVEVGDDFKTPVAATNA